jgi:mRNA interferase MazF
MPSLNKGDLIWVAKYDVQGHELKGRHPAVVVSPTQYNQITKQAVVCIITSVERGNKLEIRIPEGCGISGVIKIDVLTSIDWEARKYEIAGKLPQGTLEEVSNRLSTFLG